MSTNNTEHKYETLQIWRKYLIQNLSISSSIGDSMNNKADQSIQCSMTAMPEVDATRHLLYTALYHYRHGRYRCAISLLEEAKLKLQHPNINILNTKSITVENYRAAGGEDKPFTQMIKDVVAWPVELKADVTIPELTL